MLEEIFEKKLYSPVRHSEDQQVFLQYTHFEFDGRLPSRQ